MSKTSATKRSFTAKKKDIKDLLGNPKITFVLGMYMKKLPHKTQNEYFHHFIRELFLSMISNRFIIF